MALGQNKTNKAIGYSTPLTFYTHTPPITITTQRVYTNLPIIFCHCDRKKILSTFVQLKYKQLDFLFFLTIPHFPFPFPFSTFYFPPFLSSFLLNLSCTKLDRYWKVWGLSTTTAFSPPDYRSLEAIQELSLETIQRSPGK